MKRTLFYVSLMVAVALSATALAGTHGFHRYKGQVKHGPGIVRFSVNLERKRVRHVRFSNVNLTCDQGTIKYSREMHPRKQRLERANGDLTFRFQDSIENGASNFGIFVGGSLFKSRHYRKARGNIQVSGDLNASHTNCERVNGRLTGVGWVAHRR